MLTSMMWTLEVQETFFDANFYEYITASENGRTIQCLCSWKSRNWNLYQYSENKHHKLNKWFGKWVPIIDFWFLGNQLFVVWHNRSYRDLEMKQKICSSKITLVPSGNIDMGEKVIVWHTLCSSSIKQREWNFRIEFSCNRKCRHVKK